MVPANVKLSKNELSLVCDEQFILTKNNIIDKVYNLFGILSNAFENDLKDSRIADPEIMQNAPKIYKGENYKGLPYVMLDHPRFFNKTDAFAIRCFFWWGNFFSITLHLGGRYAAQYVPIIMQSLHENKNPDWYYCINDNQWQHDFEVTNYKALTPAGVNMETISAKNFFKLAKKIPLEDWDNAYDFFTSNFKEIITMIGENKF